MRILALESSAKAASAAIYNTDGGVLEAASFQNVQLTHSRTLLPLVEDMFKNSDLTLGDCDLVAVAHGPGSFTGVRIGVAAAKGLALGKNLPAVGVSTLEAMAYGAAAHDGVLLCAMDARRGEVYGAAFEVVDGTPLRLCDDAALAAADMANIAANFAVSRKKALFCVGDGAELCYNTLKIGESVTVHLAAPSLLRQNAVGVALAAASARTDYGNPAHLLPVYLRQSQAERERAAALTKERND